MVSQLASRFARFALVVFVGIAQATTATANVIYPNNPLIAYNGRWDSGYGSWWLGSGFTLNVRGLTSLSLQLGANSSYPSVQVGVSVNYGNFTTLQLTTNGTNVIPLTTNSTASTDSLHSSSHNSVIRFSVEGYNDQNLYLQKIILNSGAQLLPYTPSRLTFQFIGDSLSAGYLLPNGIDGAWTFNLAESYKAEKHLTAQSGACLTDQLCWGNYHGISYQFWKTEDTSYWYNPNHNYTTNWNFQRQAPPTHIFSLIGTNDYSYSVPDASLIQTYVDFLRKLRTVYPTQPIFVLGEWGWPNADGGVTEYYADVYKNVTAQRNAAGDKHVYFIETVGWIGWDDIFQDNGHPTNSGSLKFAKEMQTWLENWGLHPEHAWRTPVN